MVKPRIRQILAAGLALVMPLCVPCQAGAEDLALREAAAMSGAAMFLNARAPGLILAVVHGEDSFIEGYGETAPGSGKEPDGASIVRVGSVSKVFATDVLAAMAAAGQLSLDAPLARYAPSGKVPQAYDDRPITLLDLATHSAGLPRELADPETLPGEKNPFAGYKASHYWDWIASHRPAYRPGTTAIYSNVGFGLLGESLGKAGGKPFAELVREKITAPLGMADTALRLTEAQKPRLLTGLDPFGKPDPNWEAGEVMQASAGIYTTAEDMVRWMRWHLADDAAGRPARALAHALWRPHDGLSRLVGVEATDSEGMGLGWIVSRPKDKVPFLLGKSGGLGGFMSYVVLSPNRRLGIFVVATKVDFAMFEGLRTAVRELAAELAPAAP
ncbi:D-alanyl-D-alanine-carboxypeptidase/endopeptidase AmpH [Bosea lathyri]|uniref:D-alanyl-D-alanine-carboxypeptidase / D-alanyl-D-alanine-endopeptidase n=1 Tax=Bosea lathyri TaxID=1036778 RepID=A0A1H5ZKD9_9HYPH|nr:D-alanyl-D-alanine-carboxypeptidase/endopeptidase AmpH [Bosea lathyri]SEG36225.1 D-alanyl-D-alanine-carboxypeptidase / D-alanyl-D-alanine-endopeptidase [Bosea lathyri]